METILSDLKENRSFAVELRVDLFLSIDLSLIKNFIQRALVPVMLTVRKASQGGGFCGCEVQRELLIEQLLDLEPHFFDLEYDMNSEFIRGVLKKYSKTKIILSYHNFQKIPTDLEEICHSMQEYEASHYKIAVMVHSTNDALKMLLFGKKHPKISVICMGEKGRFTRVLGAVFGMFLNYASLDSQEQSGPGQLTISELIDVYRYPSLNKQTSIYGLIGDPIEKSPGHFYHNAVFQKQGLNAVYVKMVVKSEELSEFIFLARKAGIRGLSVTIPLKEKILPFVDEIEPGAKQIGALNTLFFKNGKIIGTNTDGLGALDAIEKKLSVDGKKIVLLGAGGAARSIAYESRARGANVLILNRTVQKAKDLALEMGCEAGGLDQVPSLYDIMVNCSPDSMPIDSKKIREGTVAMDIVYSPRETRFLIEASLKKCELIYGEEMFLNQASRQTAFWVGS